MLCIKKNNILIFFLLLAFFVTQIFTGQFRLVGTILMLLLVIFCLLYKIENVWSIIFLFLILHKAFQRISTGFTYSVITYLDEITELMLALFLIFVVIRYSIRITKREKNIIIFYGLYEILCIVSTLSNDYVTPIVAILDCFVCAKFMIFYFGGLELSKRRIFDGKKMMKYLNVPCKILAVLLLLLCIHDLFFTAFFEKFDYRFFTYALQLCFQHPTYLAAVCMICITVLIYNMKYDEGNFKYIVIHSIVTLLTFRTKAMAAVFIIFVVYFVYVKYKVPFKMLLMSVFGCVAIYAGFGSIEKYFTAGSTVPIRLKMMQDGISIAQSHFPFGAGFGTFGTTVAYENGSIFYYQLGYMSGYYLNQPVADVFWPGIFAESGWIGTIFFGVFVILMVLDSLDRMKCDKFAGWCMLSILIYTVIASTSETAFFNPATALMFIIYGIAADRTEKNYDI